MVRLDHIRIAVRDSRASRDWYTGHLDLKVEFQVSRRGVVALRDDSDVTLILEQNAREVKPCSCVLYFQVDDADAKFGELSAKGLQFVHPPRKRFWGHSPEFKDPDGYRIRLWDEKSMRARG